MRIRLWPTILSMGLLAPAVTPAQAQQSAVATSSAVSTAPEPTSYDVVSVHEHNPDDHNVMWRSTPDGISMTNISLRNLAAAAYEIRMMDLVTGGPPWLADRGFDISAKVLPADGQGAIQLTDEQRLPLLRALLADRFHLQAHVDTRTMPVYDLVLAKGGLKMKPTPAQTGESSQGSAAEPARKPNGSSRFSPGHLQAYGYAVNTLAGQLAAFVGKTVVNKTGLSGNYDFTLEFTPEDVVAKGGNAAAAGADVRPDLFTALGEQLGLKLVPAKGPVMTLVIDHAELPTAN